MKKKIQLKEQNQQTYGLMIIIGILGMSAKTATLIAIMKEHLEEVTQERKV